MSHESESVTLVARFRALDGQQSVASALIAAYGEIVRSEPGNVFFDIYTDRDDDRAFVIMERYRNEQGFHDHLNGAAGKEFNAKLAPLVEGGGSELQFLRIVD